MFNLSKLRHDLGTSVASAAFNTKKISPELYLIGAAALGVGAIILTARAHKKSEEVFEEELDILEELVELSELETDEELSDATQGTIETHRELTSAQVGVYSSIALKGVKLYGPGIAMAAGAAALILASHGVMKGRTRQLVGAVAILESGWAAYRGRVVEELGEEADARFYHGFDVRKIVTLTQDKNGKARKRKEDKNHIPEMFGAEIYSRIFDETNVNWDDEDGMNAFWLSSVQRNLNDQLYINGYMSLNSVYKALGFQETNYGQVVGWSNQMEGDNYISLGLDKDVNQREGDTRWVLDFNVNGVVWEFIGV